MKSDKNQELARLIGRRLRDACEAECVNALPPAIAGGLAKLKQVETRGSRNASDGRATASAASFENEASFEPGHNNPLDANP